MSNIVKKVTAIIQFEKEGSTVSSSFMFYF